MRISISSHKPRTFGVAVAAFAVFAAFFTVGTPKAHASGVVGACTPVAVNSKAIETYTASLRQAGDTQAQIDKALAKKFDMKKAATRTVVSPMSNAVPSDLQESLSVYSIGGTTGCQPPAGYAQLNWHFTNGVNGRVTNECLGATAWNSCHDAEDVAAITFGDGNGGGGYVTSRFATSWGYIMDSGFHWNNTYGNPEPWSFSAGQVDNNGAAFPMYTFDHWVDGSEHNPWGSDFSNANGEMGISFTLSNGSACKWVTVYGHYSHSWNKTQVNSLSVGPWQLGVGWSTTSYTWGPVDTNGQQYYLCT